VLRGSSQPAYPAPNNGAYPEVVLKDGASNVDAAAITVEVQALSISGHVVDDGGNPVADAVVKALAMPTAGPPTFSSWLKLPSTSTDSDGAFTLSGSLLGRTR
jgi:hypothetical protein